MKRVFLLTGSPGSGKTTAIQKIISRLSCEAGGFYTEEIREGSRRTGFALITMDGRSGVLAHIRIRGAPRIGKYGVDLSVMDGIAVDCLTRAMAEKDIVVIDEIGPMELLSKRFREVVMQVLESDVLVLGSIAKRRTDFTDAIKRHPNVRMVEIDRANREQVPTDIVERIRKTGRCEMDDTNQGERS
ncbi:MAG TPA: NTPase [Anaerolineae bacterium]|nr:NTPase [Anaerolineae bacterium]